MDSKDFIELQDSYKLIYSESKKDESPEKEEEIKTHDIKKIITLEDLTNPNQK